MTHGKLVPLALILSLFLNPIGFALAHPLKLTGMPDLPAGAGVAHEEEDPTHGDAIVAIAPDAIPVPTLALLKKFLGLSGALLPGHESEILGKLTAGLQSGHNRDWLRLNHILAYLITQIETRRGLPISGIIPHNNDNADFAQIDAILATYSQIDREERALVRPSEAVMEPVEFELYTPPTQPLLIYIATLGTILMAWGFIGALACIYKYCDTDRHLGDQPGFVRTCSTTCTRDSKGNQSCRSYCTSPPTVCISNADSTNWVAAYVGYHHEEAKLYVGYPVAALTGLIILPFLASGVVSAVAYAGKQVGSTVTYACTRLGECFAACRTRQRLSQLKERTARDLMQIETALQLPGFARYCKAGIEKTE